MLCNPCIDYPAPFIGKPRISIKQFVLTRGKEPLFALLSPPRDVQKTVVTYDYKYKRREVKKKLGRATAVKISGTVFPRG